MNNSTKFEDSKVNTKIILAGLWTSVTLCYLYGDYFELYTPGKIRGLVEGNNLLDSPQKLFLASVILAIPAVMVCISLTAKPVLNRLLNIIFGTFFTLIMLFIDITFFSDWYIFYAFLAIIECIITIFIIKYARSWKKL